MDRIRRSTQFVYALLNESMDSRESVLRQLNIGEAELTKALVLDETLESLVQTYSKCVLEMEDVSRELRDYIERFLTIQSG